MASLPGRALADIDNPPPLLNVVPALPLRLPGKHQARWASADRLIVSDGEFGCGFEGRPQAVDLSRISAPPGKPGIPPYRPALRDDIPAGACWFGRLTIE